MRHRSSDGIRIRAGVLVPILLLSFSGAAALADVIYCRDGRMIEGTIIGEEEKRVQILTKMGRSEAKIWIERTAIERIEKGPLAIDEFERRLAGLASDDLAGFQELLEWTRKQRLREAEKIITDRLPEVERAQRKAKHRATWCRTCDSTGKQPCMECKGTGEERKACERCEGAKIIECRACGGQTRGGLLRCGKCAGEGEIEHFDPAKGKKSMEKCSQCKGKGYMPCPTCEGKGAQPCPNCDGKGSTVSTCPRCAGKPVGECTTCKGTGIQPMALTESELAKEAAAEIERNEGEKKPPAPPTEKPADGAK